MPNPCTAVKVSPSHCVDCVAGDDLEMLLPGGVAACAPPANASQKMKTGKIAVRVSRDGRKKTCPIFAFLPYAAVRARPGASGRLAACGIRTCSGYGCGLVGDTTTTPSPSPPPQFSPVSGRPLY